jgi:hypothetical protein
MMLVLRDLAVPEKMLWLGLTIVREIEEMDHVALLLLDHLPTKVDDGLEAKSFMVLFPSVTDQNRVGLWERDELELCKLLSRSSVVGVKGISYQGSE